eukprot:12255205-Prorocentrum_lima.AAC.1
MQFPIGVVPPDERKRLNPDDGAHEDLAETGVPRRSTDATVVGEARNCGLPRVCVRLRHHAGQGG